MHAILLALVLAVSATITSAGTTRFNAPYTNSEPTNQAFDQFDKGPVGDSALTLLFCGQQANAGTTFLSTIVNNLLGLDTYTQTVGITACDTRQNATEATADVVTSPDRAIKVLGMVCQVETAEGASQSGTFTVRAAAADLSPTLTCSIAGASQIHCAVRAPTINAPIVPANTPLAVKAVSTNDQSAVGALCRVMVEVL